MENGNRFSLFDIIFHAYRISFTNISRYLPKNNYPRRIIIITYIIYCYLLNNSLQTKMISLLSLVPHQNDINTINQLSSNLRPIYTYKNYVEEIKKKYNESMYKYYHEFENNTGPIESIEKYNAYALEEYDVAVSITRSKIHYANGTFTIFSSQINS